MWDNPEMMMRGRILVGCCLSFLLMSSPFLGAAETSNGLYDPEVHDRFDWWGDVDGFLGAQARRTLDLADQAFVKYPPQFPEPIERKMALYMMDGVMHEENAPKRKSVQEFLRLRIERSLGEIEQTKVSEGAMIWKLYNETFVIRTASVTLAFDLVRGRLRGVDGFGLPDDLVAKIAAQCDVLFISHRHRDHADESVARMFLDHGKPVVAPPEIWKGKPIHSEISHMDRVPHKQQALAIQGGKGSLKVAVYPGHQGSDIENNVPVVTTPEGLSFVQTGDQSNRDDFVWIDEIHKHFEIDVLMPNCWSTDITRLADGFRPKLIIPGHENEMGHTIDHREPFWLTYNRLFDSPYPLMVMAWGERYHYKR
ncbi:MBL fold metallo-hydrolase [bacterium]|jgi:L-ascorbate metabolism protein UlaG (beta-lactamase superfamily)|nr:MBL fold metallo-hydrolase [Verrucomicrobiota bacterium]MDA7632906.1 MBL fold metallo-hydrolase [bacterium]MDA7866476.1 MBL fold metallo-hydrolase [Verrucomicrobiota bacterium]